MGIGPVDAIRQALDKAGLTLNDMDLVELNEVSQSLIKSSQVKFDLHLFRAMASYISTLLVSYLMQSGVFRQLWCNSIII